MNAVAPVLKDTDTAKAIVRKIIEKKSGLPFRDEIIENIIVKEITKLSLNDKIAAIDGLTDRLLQAKCLK